MNNPRLEEFKSGLVCQALSKYRRDHPSKPSDDTHVDVHLTPRILVLRDQTGCIIKKYGISEDGRVVSYDSRRKYE